MREIQRKGKVIEKRINISGTNFPKPQETQTHNIEHLGKSSLATFLGKLSPLTNL